MKQAELDIQVIARTIFTPPDDKNGNFIFEPENYTLMGTGSDLAEFAGRACYQSWGRPNPETATNEGYILNILRHKHYSVLEHASYTLYFQGVSRSLSHEFVRHRHFSFSQLSQRYVDSKGVELVVHPALRDDSALLEILEAQAAGAADAYRQIEEILVGKGLKKKMAREAARSVLPNATETKMVVTGNYRSWIEFLMKRDSPAADAEIREAAQMIGKLLAEKAPAVFGPEARALWDLDAVQQKEARS